MDIGIIENNITPHWAYYIGGSLFIIIFIISLIYTYHFMTHPFLKEKLNGLTWFKKFILKNRVAFFLMLDVISILSAIFFMLNGS